MMKAILAADAGWGIGKDGTMPWAHNSADLKWFKECTLGSTVMMGRKTWDSLPIKPLPDRHNIIISRNLSVDKYDNCDTMSIDTFKHIANTFESIAQYDNLETIWLIGGAQLLETMIHYLDEILISRIDGTYACDTFLPEQLIQKMFRRTYLYHDTLTIEKWVKI
jgi:dihydrofolate reductase